MEEWGRFAEAAGVDIFEVVDAIRKRPTHSNIRTPGFGVGGYCLTKDPILTKIAAKEFFGFQDMDFPFSTLAVSTNNNMPLVSLNKIQNALGGSLNGTSILLLGVSYIQDVGDTRYSPSQIFVENAESRGASVLCHDPLLDYWPELNRKLPSEIPSPEGFDAVVFAVAHELYKKLDIINWLDGSNPVILDAFNILNKKQRDVLIRSGRKFISIGRGRDL
jgi:UDP-N-acetyl-D-mannosaminuronate dehydrogenase